MKAPLPGQIGLSRRELERELAWMLRRTPDDPKALIKLLCDAVVSLLDKNNAAICQALAAQEDAVGGRGARAKET